jgi:methylmalonyl-CoA mutase N-terminal domain/subunit
VGVNEFEKPGEKIEIPILKIGKESEENQIAAINKIREKRDNQHANDSLKQIGEACQNGGNVMEPIIQAAKADVTLGEIAQKMKDIFGEWQETSVI